jgi:hypothetical protein
MTTTTKQMNLTEADIEAVERITYKSADDIAVSICRSFERLEERIDAVETRLQNRISDLEALLINK